MGSGAMGSGAGAGAMGSVVGDGVGAGLSRGMVSTGSMNPSIACNGVQISAVGSGPGSMTGNPPPSRSDPSDVAKRYMEPGGMAMDIMIA